MGRFALGPMPANPTLASSGCLEVGSSAQPTLASSGCREVKAGTKRRRNIVAASDEPVKKACKFGDGSRDSLESKGDDVSQVGLASESDRAHRERHPVFVKGCARCAFLKLGAQLKLGHGSYRHEVHGRRAQTVWLTQRPSHLPGLWGVGCTFCAFAAQRAADARGRMIEGVGALGRSSGA